MMIGDLNILAAGGDFGDVAVLIWVAFLAIFGVIRSVIKKAKARAEERERFRTGGQPEPRAPENAWNRRAPALPVNTREAMARAALRSMGLGDGPLGPPVRTPRVRRPPAPIPPPAPASVPLGPPIGSTVDEHVAAHVVAGLPKIAAPVAEPRLKVNLSSRQALRQAIVLHEILAPPKGLRQEGALWDLA